MAMFIQSNIPVPARTAKRGPITSDARVKITSLNPGQCLTVVVSNLEERSARAKKLNSTITAIKRADGGEFTLRQMYGEVDGSVAPVVRVWRTA